MLAQGQWRGFWQQPEAPAPDPETWGKTPPLPDPIAMAGIVRAEGGSRAAQLEALACDPRDELAGSVARLFRMIEARNP